VGVRERDRAGGRGGRDRELGGRADSRGEGGRSGRLAGSGERRN
jgi:hypothetical protein